MAAGNPISSNVLYLWVLDIATGAPLSLDFVVRPTAPSGTTLDHPKITTLGVTELVGWVETDSMGTRALAASVACF